MDAYTVGALKEWFDDRDLATDLQMSLNKNRTAARTKLHSILQNSEVSKILRGAFDDADDVWLAELWRIPALQIWGKICHKYEGMTDMLTGTMMEELANIVTCVTGDAPE